MQNYLITGGAGFIGSKLAKTLVDLGKKVTVIDNLSTGFLENIPDGAEFIEGNCEDQSTIKQLNRRRFDVIYHIAGQSSGEVSYDNPVLDMQANVQSTLVLLKYAVDHSCPILIYASSMSVYGDPKSLPVKETDTPEPKSFYAVGKHASENYLRIYRTFGIKTVALRLFNVYGAGQNLSNLRQGMASIYLSQAIQTNKILVKGSPERFRDFIHINDVVDAFLKSKNEHIESGVYNVCSGNRIYVKDILELISSEMENPIEISFAGSTPGDQFGIYGDPSFFESSYGFSNQITFKKGMLDMINWAKGNHL